MKNTRNLKDIIFKNLIKLLTNISILVLIGIFLSLIIKSAPILKEKSIIEILFSTKWQPFKKEFGLWTFIISTFYVTIFSLIISVPLCILSSVYLSEYCNKRIKIFFLSIIDILAGIPSVIYGIWGVIIIVPLIKNQIAPFFNASSNGYSLLAGAIVLSVMIFPIIIQITVQVMENVPRELREASIAIGATKWETIKFVVLKKAQPGIIASIIIATSRALGETIAVLMVVGNVIKIPKSVFDPAYPLPALIANNYGEMMSIPLYESAIMLSALILLIIVLAFNVLARIILIRIERKS
ncbi:MAG: phosphate ABC transporter permease subunit PstC [Spirochaetes bacterium]|nr:phosphate ABC transporter permease subunit PstC [Spirochaetota bacterium]